MVVEAKPRSVNGKSGRGLEAALTKAWHDIDLETV